MPIVTSGLIFGFFVTLSACREIPIEINHQGLSHFIKRSQNILVNISKLLGLDSNKEGVQGKITQYMNKLNEKECRFEMDSRLVLRDSSGDDSKLQKRILCLVLQFYFQQLPDLQADQTSGSELQWKEIGEYLNKLTDPENNFLPDDENFSHTLDVTYDKIIAAVISDNDFLDPNSNTRQDELMFQNHIRMTKKLHFYLQQLRELKTTSEGEASNCFEELVTFMDHMTKLQPQGSLEWEDILKDSADMIESLNGEGEVRSYYTKGNEASRKDIKICHFKILEYWALLSNEYAVHGSCQTTSDHRCLMAEIKKTLERVGQFLLMTSWMASKGTNADLNEKVLKLIKRDADKILSMSMNKKDDPEKSYRNWEEAKGTRKRYKIKHSEQFKRTTNYQSDDLNYTSLA